VDRAALRIGPQQIRSLHADELGYLFVRTAAADASLEAKRFEVFDPDGRHLGALVSPLPLESRPPPLFLGEHVYGVTRDELDVPYVVRLRLDRRRR
jgi:hypothetical protein